MQNESGKPIQKANRGDVGFDLFSVSEPEIVGSEFEPNSKIYKSVKYIEYRTGVRLEMPENIYGLIYPRSSISKKNLSLCNSVGVIDSGYRGEIIVRFNYLFDPEDFYCTKNFHNPQKFEFCCSVPLDKIYAKGDKICQLVFREHLSPNKDFALIEVSKIFEETERGSGGFGSTGE